MFQWLPLLQPQLSATSGALTPAFEHKQVLTGRRLMKLQLIVCTNPRHQKNRSENPSSLASFYFFLIKTTAGSWFLWWETQSFISFLLQASCSLLLLSAGPQFNPLSVRRVTVPLRSVTQISSDSVQGFMSQVVFGIKYLLQILWHKCSVISSVLSIKNWNTRQAMTFQEHTGSLLHSFFPIPGHFLGPSVPLFSTHSLKLHSQWRCVSAGIKHG